MSNRKEKVINLNSTKKKPFLAARYDTKINTNETTVRLSVRYARAKRKLKKLGHGYYLVHPDQAASFGVNV
jgi:hypothetical protein